MIKGATRGMCRYPELVTIIAMPLTTKEETISRIIFLLFTDHGFKFWAILSSILNKFVNTLLELRVRWGRNRGRRRIIQPMES